MREEEAVVGAPEEAVEESPVNPTVGKEAAEISEDEKDTSDSSLAEEFREAGEKEQDAGAPKAGGSAQVLPLPESDGGGVKPIERSSQSRDDQRTALEVFEARDIQQALIDQGFNLGKWGGR